VAAQLVGLAFKKTECFKFRVRAVSYRLEGHLTQSDTTKSRMITSADLLRRGATLLQEACPRCGGVQIRYQGKIYCLNEDDIESALSPKPEQSRQTKKEESKPSLVSEASSTLRKTLEEKLASVSKQLEATTDVEEQGRLLDLISKYVETLEKLNKPVS
jgi:uncharacterized Zn finger protein (UPF0148 family)